MLDFFDDPAFVHDLFDFAAGMAMRFAAAQVDAGVDIVGIGDAAASLVGPAIYEEMVWPHEKRLIDHIHGLGAAVRLHICGNMSRSVEAMGRLGADIIDLDSPVPVAAARAAMGPGQVLLGNLNPVTELMSSAPAAITTRLAACHAEAGRAVCRRRRLRDPRRDAGRERRGARGVRRGESPLSRPSPCSAAPWRDGPTALRRYGQKAPMLLAPQVLARQPRPHESSIVLTSE